MADRPPRGPLAPELELARRLLLAADPHQPWEMDAGIDRAILDATRSIAGGGAVAAPGTREVLAAAWRAIVGRIAADARAGRDVGTRVNSVIKGLPADAVKRGAWPPDALPVVQALREQALREAEGPGPRPPLRALAAFQQALALPAGGNMVPHSIRSLPVCPAARPAAVDLLRRHRRKSQGVFR